MTKTLWYGAAAICVLCGNVQATETPETKVYPQKLLANAGRSDVVFRETPAL